MLRAAQTHVRMFGGDVCLVEADKRRKNKQMLSLLKNKTRMYKMSEANSNYMLSAKSFRPYSGMGVPSSPAELLPQRLGLILCLDPLTQIRRRPSIVQRQTASRESQSGLRCPDGDLICMPRLQLLRRRQD
jgi:hypothetical protein